MALTLAPLLAAAKRDRQLVSMAAAAKSSAPSLAAAPDDIRAAVERAVERELPRLLDELTQRVLLALGH